MKRSGIGLLLACLGCVAPAQGVSAQTISCLSQSSAAAKALQDYVVRIVTGGEGEWGATRQSYNLPVAPASAVTVEKSKTVCQQAGQAYHRVLNGDAPQVARQVAVVKVGSSRYVVIDPAEKDGEYEVNMVFDAGFTFLAQFGS